MTQEQIIALDSKKHIKIWLLHKQGLTRRQIADLLGTNPGHVGNEIKAYAVNKEKRDAAEAILQDAPPPKIDEDYERQRLINAGMPDVANQRFPIKKANETAYQKASKIPKGGAVNATPDNLNAWAAETIAKKHAMQPDAIYNWAKKHGVDLPKHGHILSKVESNSALLADVLNDKYSETKALIESGPTLEYPVYQNDSNGKKTLVKTFSSHKEAENWINNDSRKSDWYFYSVGQPIEKEKNKLQSFGDRMKAAREKKAAENALKSPEDLEYDKLMRILKQTNTISAKELFAEFGVRDEQQMYGDAKRGQIFHKEYSQLSENKYIVNALKVLHVFSKVWPIKTTITQEMVSSEGQHRYENGEDTESEYGVSRTSDVKLKIYDKKTGELMGGLDRSTIRLAQPTDKYLNEAINSIKVYFEAGSTPFKQNVNFSKIISDIHKRAEEKKIADKWKTEKVSPGGKIQAKQDFEIWRQKTLKYAFDWLKDKGLKRSHPSFDKAKEDSLILREWIYKLVNYPIFYAMNVGYDIDKNHYKDSASITWQITADKWAVKNKFDKEWSQYYEENRGYSPDVNRFVAQTFAKEINPILGTGYSSSGYGYNASYIAFNVYKHKSGDGSKIQLSNGGILEGPKHGSGGIKATLPDGNPIELEGGEIIINAKAAKENCSELSKINQSTGNGVAFPCDSPALDGVQGPMAGKGAEIESEHEDLYNELASLVPGGMPISKEAFFEKIAKTHIKEDPNYYKKLEKYVEGKVIGDNIGSPNTKGTYIWSKRTQNLIPDTYRYLKWTEEGNLSQETFENDIKQYLNGEWDEISRFGDNGEDTSYPNGRGNYMFSNGKTNVMFTLEQIASLGKMVDFSKKPYYLLTKEETIAERDRLEANNTDPQRLKDLCRYSYTKFKTLLKDLK